MTDRKMWKSGLSIGQLSEAALERAAAAGLDLVEVSGIDDNANWEKVPEWEKKNLEAINLVGDVIKAG